MSKFYYRITFFYWPQDFHLLSPEYFAIHILLLFWHAQDSCLTEVFSWSCWRTYFSFPDPRCPACAHKRFSMSLCGFTSWCLIHSSDWNATILFTVIQYIIGNIWAGALIFLARRSSGKAHIIAKEWKMITCTNILKEAQLSLSLTIDRPMGGLVLIFFATFHIAPLRFRNRLNY